jgi:hypothetical protein
MPRLRQSALWLLLALLSLAAFAQIPRTKRLILTDGSYQPATQWQVKGDRVRYYSAERDEWEELPNSMVDWAATNKYNSDLENGELQNSARLAAEDAADKAAFEARSPQISPGLRLPDTGGVYMLDQFKNKPELVELVQSAGDLHKNMGRNILRAAINPIATSKQSIEIPGARARVQAHESQPAIYIDVVESDNNAAPDEADNATQQSAASLSAQELAGHYRIVKMETKKNARVVGNLKIAFYGKVSQEEKWIPTNVQPVSGDWAKVTPSKPLAPGEYALVEILGKNQINFYVWDFGFDPAAPENPPTWTPSQPKLAPAGTNESPVLDTRPH